MGWTVERRWGDLLAEAIGGAALAGGAGVSALLVAGGCAAPALPVVVASIIGLLVGWAIVRFVPAAEDELALARFDLPAVAPAEPEAALLLDDVLAGPEAESRVVQLFAPHEPVTPGDLRERIDRHLAHDDVIAPDATAALHAALDDIRRSLGRH